MLETASYCTCAMSQKRKNEANYQAARSIVEQMQEKGLKLIALDFDKTLVSVHTKGDWRDGSDALSQHFRPCFELLMKAVLDVGLYLCIVTYSTQPDLIKDVLRKKMSKNEVSRVIVRASTRDWVREHGLYSMLLGKQQHITSVITELYNRCHVIIQPKEVALFDDDSENVKVALEFSHQGMVVTDDISLDNIQEWLNVIS